MCIFLGQCHANQTQGRDSGLRGVRFTQNLPLQPPTPSLICSDTALRLPSCLPQILRLTDEMPQAFKRQRRTKTPNVTLTRK